jgi:hypothetical protein
MLSMNDFLAIENADRKHVKLKLAYIDIADGDLEAGLLLSQMAYWYAPSKETGRSKLRVKHDNIFWIAKGREEWYDEIRLAPKRFDKAIKILISKGFAEKKIFKFAGDPKVHVRIIWENFLPAYHNQVNLYIKELEEENEGFEPYSPLVIPKTGKTDLPKREKGNASNGKKEMPNSGISLTEITQESTSRKYNIDDFLFVNNEALTRGLIRGYIDDYYTTFSVGRWSKESWDKLSWKLACEIFENPSSKEIKDIHAYIYSCLKAIAHKHDIKYGKKEFEVNTGNEGAVPFYNWLEES